jgi:PAS domain S-box-containing protein
VPEKKADILELLKIVAPVLPAPIYWEDINSVLLGGNDAVFKATGAMFSQAYVGKTLFELYPHDMAQHIKTHNEEVMKTGKILSQEEVIEDITTRERKYFTAIKAPLFDTKGNVIGVIGTSVDITERKKMEEDLRQAKNAAESANYIMTEFISNMGHDLATPISDVGGIAQVLSYADEYPEFKELFETLITRAAACEKVRKSIINATSIANLEVKYETFSITEVLLDIEKELRPSIGTKNLEIVIHPLKSKKEDYIVTDPIKFHDVVFDLTSNGINFTDAGQVTISVIKEGNLFHIKVSDTGIGIPADKFDYIFQQYTKLSRSNIYGPTFKGVGAGLYLARIRANILNATISVESEVGKGSTFTFSIPAAPSDKIGPS